MSSKKQTYFRSKAFSTQSLRPKTENVTLTRRVQSSIQQARRNPRSMTSLDLLRLQSTVGNRAVSRQLTQPVKNVSSALAIRRRRATDTSRSIGLQTSSSIQRVAPAVPVVAGLTVGEIAQIVGTATAVATAVGSIPQPARNTTGKGPVMKLAFEGDYLMSAASKAQLENISRALFFMEMERLAESNKSGDSQDDMRQTAIGNVKKKVIEILDSNSHEQNSYDVANGGGGHSKVTPWGAVKIGLNSGKILPNAFGDVFGAAARHGIAIDAKSIDYVKFCQVDYDFEKDVDPISDDDIFVRGQDLDHTIDAVGIRITCTVAFDWDGDTTYYEWKDTPIRPGSLIPSPIWVGPTDPDD